jgi:glutathione-regulated potassium-efflux system ancillary protein KefG
MARILILFAHPALDKSRVHKRLIKHVQSLEGVTFHDLYETYPDLDIDVPREQQLLLEHDIIIWQHPFYWYSAPAIIKQWMDLVLEHGWAYGSKGKALSGKYIFNAISGGGPIETYSASGRNRYTIHQLLAPFEQTARLCGMIYMPPYAILGTHKLEAPDIELVAIQYEQLLVALCNNRIGSEEWQAVSFLNDLIPIPRTIQS